MRRLAEGDSFLDSFNIAVKMAIGDEDIRPAIQVIVEKETSKTQSKQRCTSDRRARRFVHEQAIPFVVVQGHHLIGKVTDYYAWLPRTIIVGCVHSHSSARHSIFAKGDACRYCLFAECSVLVVQVKLVGLGVVCDQEIGPAVIIVVKPPASHSLRLLPLTPPLLRPSLNFL